MNDTEKNNTPEEAKVGTLLDDLETISAVVISNDGPTEVRESLGSIRQLVYEIIFVDTGCPEETKEVLEEMNCKVFTYDLQDDMGAARNFGIEKASGDWILIMDSDEMMDQNGIFKLTWLLQNRPHGAYFVEVHDLKSVARLPQLRFFRNDGSLRYYGKYGEYLDGTSTKQFPDDHFANSSAIIYNQRRHDRSAEVEIYKARIQKFKKHLLNDGRNVFLLYRLGLDSEFVGRYKDAINYFKGVIEADDAGMFPLAARDLAICLEYEGKTDNALKILSKALRFYPEYTDLGFEIGMIYLKLGEYDKAIQTFKNCLDHKDSPVALPSIPGTGGVLAELGIALAGQLQGKVEESKYIMLNAMEQIQESSLQLLYLGSVLKRMYSEDHAKEVFLMLGNMENEGVQRVFQDLFGSEELKKVKSEMSEASVPAGEV